jgi:DNA polymerase-4
MGSVTWLFLDMNAYFASVEQQMRSSLRGRPVAVVPTQTDTTCCIAASYEARPFGIRTGTQVGEARRRCPSLRIVTARPSVYVRVHHEIIAAVETVLPVEQICSIDEMACRLSPQHRPPAEAIAVAHQVKQAIARQVGTSLRCSVGLATNRFLAKVASNLKKPDGLSVITREDLPHKLHSMALDDFPGIAQGMLARLHRYGVYTTAQLCALSRNQMREAWQSVLGQQWWYWLQGDDIPLTHVGTKGPTLRRTVGHSHVLPPKLRTDAGAQGVLVRLIHKAAMRLRKLEHWAGRMELHVSYLGDSGFNAANRPWKRTAPWKRTIHLGRCQDTSVMLQALATAWRERPPNDRFPRKRPLKVSITLFNLTPTSSTTQPLFDQQRQATRAAHTMDAINAQFGADCVYLAPLHHSRQTAPMRIAFTHIPEVEE